MLKNYHQKNMNRNFTFLTFILLICFASCSFSSKEKPIESNRDEALMEVISYVLSRYHYEKKNIDDAFSEKVFENFIKNIDEQKRYFLQSDIDEFSQYKHQIDDQIKSADFSFFNLVYNRLQLRLEEARKIAEEFSTKEPVFSTNESINLDYDHLSFAKSEKELKERWRKMIKFTTLSSFLSKEKEQKKILEKNADKKDSLPVKIKTSEELRKDAFQSSIKGLREVFSSYKDINREDWRNLFINSFIEVFDPHSIYMAPQVVEQFNTSISGRFFGIGAQLEKKENGVSITNIISGGPVWKGKLLEVGDLIIGVAQGNEPSVDIVGMRLDEVVKLIKGPQGTEVRLTVKRVDGTIEVVSIIRDVVELEETFAKSTLVEDKGHRFGIINLPKFYIDFDNYKERNAASDVALEIEKLKKQHIEGLVIDLRNNGGGSLRAVIEMAGLFIKEGPIVQVRSSNNQTEVLVDDNPSILWDGPLVILVNELSASASEILAAAMQDYGRAIIIGGKQTYGKGTVQNVLDLNKWVRGNVNDMGSLKLTFQKFYRINGGSTQLKGVESDIVIPDKYEYMETGERNLDNALAWDKIKPSDYQKWNDTTLQEAIENSRQRIAHHPQMALLEENAKWLKQQQDQNKFPLNYAKYKKLIDEKEAQSLKFKSLSDYQSSLTFKALPSDVARFDQDESLKLRSERWHESLQKDLYIEESVHVLEDLSQKTSS